MYFLFDKSAKKIIANLPSCYEVYDFIEKNFKREFLYVYPKDYLIPSIGDDFKTYSGYSLKTPPCRFVLLGEDHRLIKVRDFNRILFSEEWPRGPRTKQPPNISYTKAYAPREHNPLKIKKNVKFLASRGFWLRAPRTQNERGLNSLHHVEYDEVHIRSRRRKLPSSYDDKPISKFDMRKSWKYNSKRSKQWNPE